MGHLYQETPKQKSWLANGLFIVFGATLFYILTLENDINQSNNYFIFVPPKTYQDQDQNHAIREVREVEVKGWPPDRDRDMKLYLQPKRNTTIIKPKILDRKLPLVKDIQDGDNDKYKWRILICVHTALASRERRAAIRSTWATDQAFLPVKVIFLVGVPGPGDKTDNVITDISAESDTHGDILQESFVDTYANLTLKSMFMLKQVVQERLDSTFDFIMKVDDDSYVNLRRLIDYLGIIKKRCGFNCILGHVLGPDSPVIRPGYPRDDPNFTVGWEVPHYIYPENLFPNAVSGSGYLLSAAIVGCIYESGLDTPFVNLEDVFITGLAASKCAVKLKNSQWFNFVGKRPKLVKRQDILVHGVRDVAQMKMIYKRLH